MNNFELLVLFRRSGMRFELNKNMQVILLKNVEKLGRAGEVKNVSDGYAMNFLLPKKMAEAVTAEKINKLKNKETGQIKNREKEREAGEKQLKKLMEIKGLVIERKVSENGKLFAGIGEKEIAEELKKQKRAEVAEKFIKMAKHIKETGVHRVGIDFGNNLKTEITIKVVSDKK